MRKKHTVKWTAVYAAILSLFTAYVLLDAFVIPRSYLIAESSETASAVETAAAETAAAETAAAETSVAETSEPVVTDTSYSDGSISITITQYRAYDTDIYVADIVLTDASELMTAFAKATYGKNVTATVSDIASANSAILAINGDYYSARSGYVVRNGVVYRSTSSDSSQEDLVIWSDGSFEIVCEGDVTAQELLDAGAEQVLSFGPALIINGAVSVGENDEVYKAMTTNPRTAIGIIDTLHYVMVVADGRTDESVGLSLYELADFMRGLGVSTAYNLDGGGSSTMVFLGEVVNNPTTSGSTIKERKVSDIVYI